MQEAAPDFRSFPPPWNYLIPIGRKLLIWGLFFLILYLLRRFFLLVFLTFVFSYIAEHGVRGLAHRIRSRKLRTAIVFIALIGVIGLIGAYLGPELKNQAGGFLKSAPDYLQEVDRYVADLRRDQPWLGGLLPDRAAKDLLGDLLGLHQGSAGAPAPPGDENGTETLRTLFTVFKDALGMTSAFLLSLLFAFLIVRDLPRISRGIASLKNTKLRFFYDEVANSVFRFGQVLGRFLEAQLVIAIMNTAFTSIGMLILGIRPIAFLAGVVFLCSFIPVAGVFISTVPICLVALKIGGFGLVLWVIAMVTLVHMIEAYVLNPLIMGHHLRLNPVLVLAVLIVGHQLFGLWGLLLGVPTVTYVFSHAIREPSPPDGKAAPAGSAGAT